MINLQKAKKIAVDACLKAEPCILEGYTSELSTKQKTDVADVVTRFDVEAQTIIHDVLHAEFPECGFVGEEDATTATQSMEYSWVVDPIDGTSNYSRHLPHFGTSIGLLHHGEPVLGVLHFPVLRETYTAIQGEGAFKNDKPIAVQDCADLKDAFLCELFSDRIHRGLEVLYPPSATYRRFGSAISSLAYLAEGKVDGVFLRCHLWDVAAASVIIREAGGEVMIKQDDPADPRSTLFCIASSKPLFASFSELIQREYMAAHTGS